VASVQSTYSSKTLEIYVDFRTYSKAQPAIKFLCDELKANIIKDPFLSDYERCVRHAYKDEIDAPIPPGG
jgi:hypothetical protein